MDGDGTDEDGDVTCTKRETPTDLDARRSAQRLAPQERHHEQQLHGGGSGPRATPQQPTGSGSYRRMAWFRLGALRMMPCPRAAGMRVPLLLDCAGARRRAPRNTDEAREGKPRAAESRTGGSVCESQ
ncbi:hypothetical protein F2P81_010816 [Scophthalmus maximus]|nr:hypothetical protein F2P81_010816 [Scophthalmus maximus]